MTVFTLAGCHADNQENIESMSERETAAVVSEQTVVCEQIDEELLKEISVFESDDIFTSFVPFGTEFNVKDFGAKGDGMTDDSEAVMKAIESAKEKVGGTVYFPAGKYLITQNINFGPEMYLAFSDYAWLYSQAKIKVNCYVKAGNHNLFEGEGKYTFSLKNPISNPVWFGARGDGLTDDTQAFQTAFLQKSDVMIPFSEKGYVIGDFTLSNSVRIVGISNGEKRTKIIGLNGSEHIFKIMSGTVQLSNFDVCMSDSDASVFYYDTSLYGLSDLSVKDVDVYGAKCVVNDSGVVQNFVTNSLVENVNCYDCRGTAFDLKCFWGFIFFRNLTIDVTQTEQKYNLKPNFPLVRIANNAGCIFQNIDTIGTGDSGCSFQSAFSYTNNVATWMDGCSFSNISGSAVKIEGGSNSFLYFSNLNVDGCLGDAFDVNSVYYGMFNRVKAVNCKKSCLVIRSSFNFEMSGCDFSKAESDGILLLNSYGTVISDSSVKECGGFGVNSEGSMGTLCSECILSDNSKGNINGFTVKK